MLLRAVHVVVVRLFFDDLAGMSTAGEKLLIEPLIAKLAVRAFHEAILHRLARRDVVPLDTPIFLPRQDGIRDQLSAIVRYDHAG